MTKSRNQLQFSQQIKIEKKYFANNIEPKKRKNNFLTYRICNFSNAVDGIFHVDIIQGTYIKIRHLADCDQFGQNLEDLKSKEKGKIK